MPGPKPEYPITSSELQVAQRNERSQRYTAPYSDVVRAFGYRAAVA